jgi:LysM repeat protein
MIRTGIPASIKLAQGLVESNCGCSELAKKANNHFGIKCGGDWAGKSFHKEDDDYLDGELTKSCFREFKSPEESFIAHSDFLTDPKKSARYGFLFQLKSTDYEGWAKGLSKSGYATDPRYADKLIKIIEDNRLYDFDLDNDALASAKPSSSLGSTMIRSNNNTDYAVALEGDNMTSISMRYGVKMKQLAEYNDYAYAANDMLPKGTKVYLENKQTKFHGKQKYYVIKTGEDLIYVSQLFGMKLSALQKRNGVEGNQVPAPGQKIMLKGKSKVPLKTNDPYQLPKETTPPPVDNAVAVNTTTISSAKTQPVNTPVKTAPVVTTSKTTTVNTKVVTSDSTKIIGNQQAITVDQHVVGTGETLFSIAKNYGLSVDDLKKINNLSVDTIFIGQKLIIK